MSIGRLHHVIFDCPEPLALATFYSELLGTPIAYTDDDFAVVALTDRTSGLAFQRATDQFTKVLGLSGPQAEQLAHRASENLQAVSQANTVLARGR